MHYPMHLRICIAFGEKLDSRMGSGCVRRLFRTSFAAGIIWLLLSNFFEFDNVDSRS